MLSSSQQSVEPMQSSCSSPIMLIIALTENTCAQLEKIISLNMAMSTASVQESHRAFQKLLATTSPQEFLSIAIGQLESNMHSIRNYSCNLLELAEKTEKAETKLQQSGVRNLALQAETKTEAIPETAPYIVPDVDANTKADADNHAAKARQARKTARPAKNKVGYRKR